MLLVKAKWMESGSKDFGFYRGRQKMTEEQGREASDKGFRTDTMCQTNGTPTPTPISNSEWMFKKKKKQIKHIRYRGMLSNL